MLRKYIDELSKEELQEVFMANEKLRGLVVEDMIDVEDRWNNNSLSLIKDGLYDWNVGYQESYRS